MKDEKQAAQCCWVRRVWVDGDGQRVHFAGAAGESGIAGISGPVAAVRGREVVVDGAEDEEPMAGWRGKWTRISCGPSEISETTAGCTRARGSGCTRQCGPCGSSPTTTSTSALSPAPRLQPPYPPLVPHRATVVLGPASPFTLTYCIYRNHGQHRYSHQAPQRSPGSWILSNLQKAPWLTFHLATRATYVRLSSPRGKYSAESSLRVRRHRIPIPLLAGANKKQLVLALTIACLFVYSRRQHERTAPRYHSYCARWTCIAFGPGLYPWIACALFYRPGYVEVSASLGSI